jgi:hypothetical protein
MNASFNASFPVYEYLHELKYTNGTNIMRELREAREALLNEIRYKGFINSIMMKV